MKTKLSKILYDKGWTEMELSRRTGLAQSYINRVKNARVVPTVRTALRICRALDVAVEHHRHGEPRDARLAEGQFHHRDSASTCAASSSVAPIQRIAARCASS